MVDASSETRRNSLCTLFNCHWAALSIGPIAVHKATYTQCSCQFVCYPNAVDILKRGLERRFEVATTGGLAGGVRVGRVVGEIEHKIATKQLNSFDKQKITHGWRFVCVGEEALLARTLAIFGFARRSIRRRLDGNNPCGPELDGGAWDTRKTDDNGIEFRLQSRPGSGDWPNGFLCV